MALQNTCNVGFPEFAAHAPGKVAAVARFSRLTVREREISIRIAAGQLPKRIHAEMGLSKKTISTHRAKVLKKLGVATSTEVAILAFQAGLVGSP